MATVAHIPAEVSREMHPGEKPLWIGRPIPKKYAIEEGRAAFWSAIVCSAIGVFMVIEVRGIEDIARDIIGLIIIVVLTAFPIAILFEKYWRARKTIYVVSNQRLLILNGLLRSSTKFFNPSDIHRLDIDAAHDGGGSIIFQERVRKDPEGGWFTSKIGFKAVPQVQVVADHIASLKERFRPEVSPEELPQGTAENYLNYKIERVGDDYFVGDDTFSDLASAKDYINSFWARAEQEYAETQRKFGALYERGLGFPRDYVLAHMWYSLAVASGNDSANKDRDTVARLMTPAQVADAERMAREWLEKHKKK